jgi:hypothetical protein
MWQKTNINRVDIIAKVIVSLHKIKATLISSGALIIETLTNQSDIIIWSNDRFLNLVVDSDS